LPRTASDSEKRGEKTDARLFVWNHVFEIGFVANRTGDAPAKSDCCRSKTPKQRPTFGATNLSLNIPLCCTGKSSCISRTGFSGIDKYCEFFSALRVAVAAQDV
jgi:hypothetical protein